MVYEREKTSTFARQREGPQFLLIPIPHVHTMASNFQPSHRECRSEQRSKWVDGVSSRRALTTYFVMTVLTGEQQCCPSVHPPSPLWWSTIAFLIQRLHFYRELLDKNTNVDHHLDDGSTALILLTSEKKEGLLKGGKDSHRLGKKKKRGNFEIFSLFFKDNPFSTYNMYHPKPNPISKCF